MVGEVGEAAGAVAAEVLKTTGGLMGRLFGDAIDELGRTLGDRARLFRLRNLGEVLEKAQRIVHDRGYTDEQLHALPFGDALRFTEGASLEEGVDVQALWARLLANASSVENGRVQKHHAELLKSLAGPECLLLQLLHDFDWTAFRSFEELHEYNTRMEAAAAPWRAVQQAERTAHIQNLLRLRLVGIRAQTIEVGKTFAYAPREVTGRPSREWAYVNPKEMQKIIEAVVEQIGFASGAREFAPGEGVPLSRAGWFGQARTGLFIAAPEQNYVLTALGRSLMEACSNAPTPDEGDSKA